MLPQLNALVTAALACERINLRLGFAEYFVTQDRDDAHSEMPESDRLLRLALVLAVTGYWAYIAAAIAVAVALGVDSWRYANKCLPHTWLLTALVSLSFQSRIVLFCSKPPQQSQLLLPPLHPFNGLFSRTTWVSRYQKGKMSLDLTDARDDGGGCDGSGISWTICKQSAPRFRQIITPTPHHSVFTGRILFLAPNQECPSFEGNTAITSSKKFSYRQVSRFCRSKDFSGCKIFEISRS